MNNSGAANNSSPEGQFGETVPLSSWKIRHVAKVILMNKAGEVALIGNAVHGYLTLPGGGVEDGESYEEAAVRECLEETGCTIRLDRALGTFEDARGKNHIRYISHGFIATVTEEAASQPTEEERDTGLYLKWVSRETLGSIASSQFSESHAGKIDYYNTSFNVVRDQAFISKFLSGTLD